MLKRSGVPHEVLNAKYHEREAAIVAQAGRKGAVTVATNMAGRGTDIMLGGNPEFIADAELHQRGLSPVDTPEDYEAAWPEAVEKARRAVADEHEEVVAVGGLYVLGTERHESRRIDNQLRGRSGRQGDPGESRFYLSLEDDLMRMFNADKVAHFMEWLKTPPDVPIESKAVTRSIRSAQTQVEQQNFEIRKDVLKYDDVLNRQRQVIYGERRTGAGGRGPARADPPDDRRGGHRVRRPGRPARASPRSGTSTSCGPRSATCTPDAHRRRTWSRRPAASGRRCRRSSSPRSSRPTPRTAYDRREAELTPEVMRELERRVVLSVLDRKWREHLYEMDYLREGIGLRAMAQRDPLVEYQREGFDMFNAMMEGIKEESVGYLFNSRWRSRRARSWRRPPGSCPRLRSPSGSVPGNGAPGAIEDSGAPGGAAPQWTGCTRRSAPAGGAGGRGSRGRHAKGAAARRAAASRGRSAAAAGGQALPPW